MRAEMMADPTALDDCPILVAADLFRLIEGPAPGIWQWHQQDNMRWLRVLLARIFAANPAIRIGALDHAALGLHPGNFGPAGGIAPHDWWRARFNAPLAPDLAARIGAAVRGRVVFAFELPAGLRAAIAATARAVIDIELAPLRFLDDLLLMLDSSDPDLAAMIAEAAIPRAEIAAQLETLRAHMGSLAAETAALPAGSALVAAQTVHDRVLIDGDRFVSLADHAPAIAALAARHPLVLIAPHPHAVGDIAGIEALCPIPGLRITAANSYRLLASGRIATLAAISSSLLAEAGAFGVAGLRLDPRPPRGWPMLRAAALGTGIARHIARLAGFDLPDRDGLPGGPVLAPLLGIDWGRAAIARTADPLPALRLDRGLPCHLSATDPACAAGLAYGWYPVEPWGVWGGPFGVFSFAWPAGRTTPLNCTLGLRAFSPAARPQKLAVWIDGEQITSGYVPTGKPVELNFDIPLPTRPGPVQIWLVCRGAWRPCDHDPANADRRRLGVALLGIAFR